MITLEKTYEIGNDKVIVRELNAAKELTLVTLNGVDDVKGARRSEIVDFMRGLPRIDGSVRPKVKFGNDEYFLGEGYMTEQEKLESAIRHGRKNSDGTTRTSSGSSSGKWSEDDFKMADKLMTFLKKAKYEGLEEIEAWIESKKPEDPKVAKARAALKSLGLTDEQIKQTLALQGLN